MSIAPWNELWFGFWSPSAEQQGRGNLPRPEDFIDPTWDEATRSKAIAYLQHTPTVVAASGTASCLLCSTHVPTAAFASDGVWLWPVSLLHYVSKHAVRPPDELLAHMAQQQWRPQVATPVDLGALPWPP